MALTYLKQAPKTSTTDAGDVRDTVQSILNDIESGGEEAARRYASQFDKYEGNIVLTKDEIAAATDQVPQKLKDDIRFAYDNVRRFAEAQKKSIVDFETEVVPGLIAGQRSIPVNSAGCYVPGGRYSHIASAIMTVTTAKVAGCKHIAACSPSRPRRRHRTSNRLHSRYLRRRQHSRARRRAGRCSYGIRAVRCS